MKKKLLLSVALAVVIALGSVMIYQITRAASPYRLPVEPDMDVRNAVAGRKPSDVNKMVIVGGLVGGPVTVTDREHIAALLAGMQEAIKVKEDSPPGLAGPILSVYWKNGKTDEFYFVNNCGVERAFGTKFAKAFNHIVIKRDKVKMRDE